MHILSMVRRVAAFSVCVVSLLWGKVIAVSEAADLLVSSPAPTITFDDTNTADPIDWTVYAGEGSFIIANSSGPTFSIDEQAPFDSFRIDQNGSLGLGAFAPQAELHILRDSSPRLRLEQTGKNFWDLLTSNGAFLIADGIGNFPLSIDNPSKNYGPALSVDDTGKVRVDQGRLHISGAPTADLFSGVGTDLTNGPAFNFGYSGASFGRSSGFFNVRPDALAIAPNPSLRFATANVQRMIIDRHGNVGIGLVGLNPIPSQKLEVNGNIRATGSFIAGGTFLNVPDYVFAPDYKLRPLTELATFIAKEQHLPEIPSAQEIKATGVDLSTFQMQLLKKIEELTLYTLQQEQNHKSQEQTIRQQSATIDELTAIVKKLTVRLSAIEQQRAR